MTSYDLATESTEALIHELQRRFQACVVITDRDGKLDASEEDIEVRASGGHARSIGLAVLGLVSIVGHYQSEED